MIDERRKNKEERKVSFGVGKISYNLPYFLSHMEIIP